MARVLIGYDRTPRCDRAIAAAADLFPGAHAVVLHVGLAPQPGLILPGAAPVAAATPGAAPEAGDAAQEAAREVAEAGAREAERLGLRATPATEMAMASTGVADAIIRTAADRNADAIVMASRGRSTLKAALLGSVSQAVAQHADRPVLIVPDAE